MADTVLQNLKAAKVLVVGDVMLDRYLWGEVGRISPEAPVPVVKMQNTTLALGGAGNVAANLAGLGCAVTAIGLCGRDQRAETVRQLLAQKKINSRLVEDPSRPTITKTRIMAHKQQVLRLDEEDDGAPAPAIFSRIAAHMEEELSRSQVLILSDYGKGLFGATGLAQKLIGLARSRNCPVLVDPKGLHWERYRGATCVTPNTAELEAVAGRKLGKDDALLAESARGLRSRLGLQWLLVTRGAEGMCLMGPDDEISLIPAQAMEVYDVSGAGDTVIATLAAALAAGASFPEAARMANTAAGIVVGKLGTQPILHSELATAMRFTNGGHYYPYSAAKLAALDGALAKVRQWRSAGEKIVFTNGCFDLLHPGHVSLLYQARAFGDRLVVGLNTDASVTRLKGPERPILSEQDRAAILGALACVDLVVHFDEDTPLSLINALRPDVLVKGSDYTPEEVVGKTVVEAYGGVVKLVDLVQGYSTTRLTEKMASGSAKKNE